MSKSAEVIQLEGATLRQQLLTPIATISDYVSEISQSLRSDDMLHDDLGRISDGCKNLRGQVGDLIEGQVLLNTREAGDLSKIRHDLKNPLIRSLAMPRLFSKKAKADCPKTICRCCNMSSNWRRNKRNHRHRVSPCRKRRSPGR